MKVRSMVLSAAVVLVPCVAASSAGAGVIVSAVSVSGPSTVGSTSWQATINQAGLQTPYVSGVTDLATYLAGPSAHIGGNATLGVTLTNPVANVDFDLGSSQFVTDLLFWNYRFASSGGVRLMDVFTSDTADFSTSTAVGTFSPLDNAGLSGNAPVPVQVFDLIDTNARYVRLTVRERWSTINDGFGFSEVAFVVPTPGAATLLALGGLLAARRRR
jgi:hypothetical protein